MLLSSIRLTTATYEHAAQNVYDPADCSSPHKSIYCSGALRLLHQ